MAGSDRIDRQREIRGPDRRFRRPAGRHHRTAARQICDEGRKGHQERHGARHPEVDARHGSMTTVETPRLRLRPMQESDAEPFLEIHQDPEVIKYVLLGAPPGGIAMAWRNIAMMIGHWQLRGYGS